MTKVEGVYMSKKNKVKIYIITVDIILLGILAGGWAVFNLINGESKGLVIDSGSQENESKSESSGKVTEAEKGEIISILNSTRYISEVPSSLTYGQIVANAFLEYTLEISKKTEKENESIYRVSVSGLFMGNPTIKQDYLEIKSFLGESTAKQQFASIVYETTLVFEVNLKKKTVKHLYGTESSILRAYALKSF